TDANESCDDGEDNSDSEPNACRTDCWPARCGDGVVDEGEECDDGAANTNVGYTFCRLDCTQPGERPEEPVLDVGGIPEPPDLGGMVDYDGYDGWDRADAIGPPPRAHKDPGCATAAGGSAPWLAWLAAVGV